MNHVLAVFGLKTALQIRGLAAMSHPINGNGYRPGLISLVTGKHASELIHRKINCKTQAV